MLPVLCFSPDTRTGVLSTSMCWPHLSAETSCCPPVPPRAPLHAIWTSTPQPPRDTEDRAVPEASSVGGPAPRTLTREQDQGRQLLGEGSGPAPSTAVGTDHWTRALSHARAAVSHPHPSAQPW